jgi:mRNA-degrading endonuclease toxin of MazEF toxin-antitoxin module
VRIPKNQTEYEGVHSDRLRGRSTLIKCEQILTVSKDRLSPRPIGRLDGRELGQVESAILLSLGIAPPS